MWNFVHLKEKNILADPIFFISLKQVVRSRETGDRTGVYQWPLLWFNSVTEHLSPVLRQQCALWGQIVPEKHGLRFFPHVLPQSAIRCPLLGRSSRFKCDTACLSPVPRQQHTSGAWIVPENVKFCPFKRKKYPCRSEFPHQLHPGSQVTWEWWQNRGLPMTFTLI